MWIDSPRGTNLPGGVLISPARSLSRLFGNERLRAFAVDDPAVQPADFFRIDVAVDLGKVFQMGNLKRGIKIKNPGIRRPKINIPSRNPQSNSNHQGDKDDTKSNFLGRDFPNHGSSKKALHDKF